MSSSSWNIRTAAETEQNNETYLRYVVGGSNAGHAWKNDAGSNALMWLDGDGSLDVTNALSAASMSVAGEFSAAEATLGGLELTGPATISSNNSLMFGAGLTKEGSAGNIGYQLFGDSLDVVGAGTDAGDRKVRVWEKLGVGKDPNFPLDVAGDARVSKLTTDDTEGAVFFGNAGHGVGRGLSNVTRISGEPHANDVSLYTNGGGAALVFGTSLFERMRIIDDGKVGVGTSTPAEKLDVNGVVKCDRVIAAGVRHDDGELYLGADQAHATNLNYNTPHPTRIFNGTTPSAVFNTDGRIGLNGVAEPARELHARGVLRLDRQNASSVILTTWTDGDFSTAPVKSYNVACDATGFKISDIGSNVGGAGADRIFITSGGNVGINTSEATESLQVSGSILFDGALISASDERLKENVVPIEGALDKVRAMRGVEFSWKDGCPSQTKVTENKYIGFIAQEVRDVVPELVHEKPDGYMSVEYANATALLLEAVKELADKVDAMGSV
jgi:hypothetical protein